MRQILAILAAGALVAPGCSKGDNGETDTGTDTDAAVDTAVDDASGEDPGVDTTDVVEDETPPECTGPDSFTIEFVEDGLPVEGVLAAIRCGAEIREATSGADGRVTFDDLDLAAIPVDLTYVHGTRATTWLSYGGPRTVPAVMQVDYTDTDYTADWGETAGDVVHGTAGSVVIVSGPGSMVAETEDRYSIQAPTTGTGLPMAFYEYTFAGGVATPIGFSKVSYDAPAAGVDGPQAVADPAAVFSTKHVSLHYDLATGSPLHGRTTPEEGPLNYMRPYFGMYLLDMYEDAGGAGIDYSIETGVTTAWTIGFDTDTLAMSWVPAAMTGTARPVIVIADSNGYWMSVKIPEWEVEEGATLEMRDVCEIPGLDAAVPVTMEDDLEVAFPPWARTVNVALYRTAGFGVFNVSNRWMVIVPPEGRTFSFSGLPFPSAASVSDLIPSLGTTMLAVYATEADADPWEGYAGWGAGSADWWDAHYIGRSVDGRFRFAAP